MSDPVVTDPIRAVAHMPQIPQWAVILMAVGIPLSGGAGGLFGAQQTTDNIKSDLTRLESKVEVLASKHDQLDEKLDELKYTIIRVTATDPRFTTGGQP